jgi:hypothetical protein
MTAQRPPCGTPFQQPRHGLHHSAQRLVRVGEDLPWVAQPQHLLPPFHEVEGRAGEGRSLYREARRNVRNLLLNPLKSPLFLLTLFLLLLLTGTSHAQTNQSRSLILVIGAPGEPEYAEQFSTWAGLWKTAAAKSGLQTSVIGETAQNPDDDLQRLLGVLTNEVAKPAGELWLVFIGHGTFDGRSAKFNLRGPDLSATNLAAALKPCRRPLVVIQCASASGPFLNALSGPGRVIITATRSGNEVNVTRFGGYFARAIADPAADLDKDGQTSLLEAYLAAAGEVAQFYKDQGRLMTEHALLDDNGDGLGTPAEWFRGTHAFKLAANGKSVDGVRANQIFLVPGDAERQLPPEVRAHRDELEQKLSALRSRKAQMNEDDYYRQLEAVLLELARLYNGQQGAPPKPRSAAVPGRCNIQTCKSVRLFTPWLRSTTTSPPGFGLSDTLSNGKS